MKKPPAVSRDLTHILTQARAEDATEGWSLLSRLRRIYMQYVGEMRQR